ncbi:MAG: response regulator [Scytonema sp. PMC 1069.18]|nr:response regulator [Scytonema sp. PMC 1069.18]MEC4886000.1 response regulator [Scytonema sp. PMC 1070.18]
MKILLVEDDEAIAKPLAAALSKQHYVVSVAGDGQAGWEFATLVGCDLILLDVILPKVDGISLCRKLRREGYQMPILLLTAKNSRKDKVIGLDAGADDYVVKPFDFQELTARIRALLRRGHSALPPVLEWGNLCLEPSSYEVTYNSQVLHLTPKEYAILELFLRNNQRVFSRSAIIENLWTFDDQPEENTIKSHIKSLRQKMIAVGAPKDFIETVYGLGYRLKPISFEKPISDTSLSPEIDTKSVSTQQHILLAVTQGKKEFKAKISAQLSVLEQMVKSLKQKKFDNELLIRAKQEAHKLSGALGTFGFTIASQLAQGIEDILLTDINSLNQAQSQRLCELVTQLHQELEFSTNCDRKQTFH